MIRFVRQLRMPHWKRGFAVDRSGKRWRGFTTSRTDTDIAFSGYLGDVGICFCCGGRVFRGWECMDSQRDICDHCALLPDAAHVFVIEPRNDKEWQKIRKEFFTNGHFDYKRRNENPGGPGT